MHVIDDAMHYTPRSLWQWRPVAQALPRARRFILTDNASIQLGKILGAAEDLILKNHQFALAPYEVTYLEVNTRLVYQAAGKTSTADLNMGPGSGDERVGYLLAHDKIWVCSRGQDGSSLMSPFVFSRDGLMARVHDNSMRQLDEDMQNLVLFLGSGVHSVDDQTADELLSQWSARHTFGKTIPHEGAIMTANGDLRNVITILLMLNQPQRVTLTSVGHSSGLLRGKRVVYAAHNVVELELGRTRAYRKLFSHYPVDRQSPRRHEVRGHFVHHPGWVREGCTSADGHTWPTMPSSYTDEGSPRWTCRTCGGHRVWRKNFLRGDAGRGFVTKEYEVVEERKDV